MLVIRLLRPVFGAMGRWINGARARPSVGGDGAGDNADYSDYTDYEIEDADYEDVRKQAD